MGRKSSIRQLPRELRDELDAAIREGRLSIDDLTALVRDAGAHVSRSAVGRYAKSMEEEIADLRRSSEVAKAVLGEVGANASADVGRLASELLKMDILRGIQLVREEGGVLPAEEKMFIANALRATGSYDKTVSDLWERARKQVAAEAAEKMRALEVSAGKGGSKLDAETLKRIREEVYGIV